MRVLITGGAGVIGRALSERLARAGHEVIALSRSPDKAEPIPGAAIHGWDARTAAGWGHLADGAGAIVNLAGASLDGARWSRAYKQEIRQSRIHAGQAVVEAVRAATVKPRAVVQMSGSNYYGNTGDEVVTEAHPNGSDFLAKVCFDWEIATAPVERMGVRRAVARSAAVLNTQGGALPRMALPYKCFVGGPVGSGRQWLSWIHLEDAARALEFLIENEAAQGPFNVAAPNPLRNKEFGQVMGKVMGRPAFMPAPGFAVELLFGEQAVVVLEGQRIAPKRLQELGFTWRYPELEGALADLLGKPAPRVAAHA